MNRHALVAATIALAIGAVTPWLGAEEPGEPPGKTRIACVGDSITYGARLQNRAEDSYPARLQRLLGNSAEVTNFGVGGCTLIRKGRPTVWNQLGRIEQARPDVVIISLGTNDTCGGTRRCWDHHDEFPADCRDLIDTIRAFPSEPRVWICAPTPMVLETPGLSPKRKADLTTRKPRLQQLIAVVRRVAEEKEVGLIDLNTPLADRPELFTISDGVHPNRAGYRVIAERVCKALKHAGEVPLREHGSGELPGSQEESPRPEASVPGS